MEELQQWINDLNRSDKLIIVEGINDRAALEKLGISNEIVVLKKPLYAVVEEVAAKEKEVVILTDFDKKGKELYGRLKKGLIKLGVKVDGHFREFLQRNTKISHIEGINTYFNRLEQQ